MKFEKNTSREELYPGVIFVRDYANVNDLANQIIKQVKNNKQLTKKNSPNGSVHNKQATRIFLRVRKPLWRKQKIIIDFEGLSSDNQSKIASQLKNNKDLCRYANSIEIKDGPFSFSGKQLRKEIFGERR